VHDWNRHIFAKFIFVITRKWYHESINIYREINLTLWEGDHPCVFLFCYNGLSCFYRAPAYTASLSKKSDTDRQQHRQALHKIYENIKKKKLQYFI
jgi:hypothetical protein